MPRLIAAFAIVAVVFQAGIARAQSGLEWVVQFGTAGDDVAQAAAIDGTLYVVGHTGGTLPGQTAAGGFRDAFIRAMTPSGAELWTRQFGTTSGDVARGVAAHSSGIYVVGAVAGDALPGQVSAGSGDAFVRKYDATGAELWTRQFGTPFGDAAIAVAVDAGDVYVVGATRGELPGQTSAGSFDTFVRKYDHAGTVLWTRQFGGPDEDEGIGVAVDSTGVYVVGDTRAALPGQSFAGGSFDVFVRKYDLAGAELWTRQFGTPATDSPGGIAVDASGVYVAGVTTGTLPGQTGSGVDAFVRKYDTNGNEAWTRQFGPGAAATAVALHASTVYVAGLTDLTLPGETSAGQRDAFVRTYDTAGNEVSTQQFGTSSFDEALALAVDATGVYVAGQTSGAFPGQSQAGAPLTNDAFVAKLLAIQPADAVQDLIDTLNALPLPRGAPTSLLAPLGEVIALLTDGNPGNDGAACGKLSAFINQVNIKLANGTLTADDAADLIAQATAIETSLGCP